MDPRLNVVTLGVSNVARSKQFYEKLGWKASSSSNQNIAIFSLQNIVLCLYPEPLLAEDAEMSFSTQSKSFRGFTLSYNVYQKEDVTLFLDRAVAAGGKLQKAAVDVFWGGHSGYFQDLDGHLWEVAWNPHWTLKADGLLQVP